MSSFEPSAPAEIRIKVPLLQRVFVGIFSLVWFGGLGTALFLGLRDSSVPFPLVFMFLFGLFVFNGILRLRLVASGDELTVRNAYKTVRLPRSEIAEFRTGRGTGGAGSRTILVVPFEGDIVSVDVSRRLGSGGGRLAENLAALESWHRG